MMLYMINDNIEDKANTPTRAARFNTELSHFLLDSMYATTFFKAMIPHIIHHFMTCTFSLFFPLLPPKVASAPHYQTSFSSILVITLVHWRGLVYARI